MKREKLTQELKNKYSALKETIATYEKVAVAFSAGIDSTLLLFAAREALGDKVIAITATSCFFPGREEREAICYCKELGVKHVLLPVDELSNPEIQANPRNRCYLCKRDLFGKMKELALKNGALEVLEGSNLDDTGDYRPGLVAVEELGIKSPLRELGFTKEEIRNLAKELDIPSWNKPSFACLATRIPYGEPLSKEVLDRIDQGEQLLMELGFHQFRVRVHGDMARIELLPREMDWMLEESVRNQVHEAFQKLGFTYVALDLKGYRTGSMNETLF